MSSFSEKVAFIWSVADLLRGPYKPHQYGRVILPLTVLRRLDCVLEPSKAKVLERHTALKDSKIKEPEPILNKIAGHAFHNTSKLDFQKLKGDPDKTAQNLSHYIKSFSSRARQVFEYFEFEKEIAKLDESNRLFLVLSKFADIDLHPDAVPNHEMGLVFEDLIRRHTAAKILDFPGLVNELAPESKTSGIRPKFEGGAEQPTFPFMGPRSMANSGV